MFTRLTRTAAGQRLLAQLALSVGLVLIGVLLVHTLTTNLAKSNMTPGFGFLFQAAGIQMGDSVISFEYGDTFGRAILAGLVNTVRVSVVAIVLALLLGTLLGIMRLSLNPLLRGLTSVYVEVFRNTPLLLQVLFWSAILLKLPSVQNSISIGNWLHLSQRGLQLPAIVAGGGAALWIALACAAAIFTAALAAWRMGRSKIAGGVCVAGFFFLIAALFATGALAIVMPVRKPLGFSGGVTLSPEFCALVTALVIYAAAFISESVRAGILSVPRGQWEAARSLGLRNSIIYRRIILPQAFRVIMPPLISQCIGIIKNSSLAVAIGFPELFWAISTAINTTGHAIEGIGIMMAIYVALTLGTAVIMNGCYAWMLRGAK